MSPHASPRLLTGVFAAVLLVSLVAYSYFAPSGDATLSTPPTHFSVNGKTFTITYLATTDAQRHSGLMNRQITNTTTMLFVFPSLGTYQFYMLDTNTSLDMIWMKTEGNLGEVVYIVTGAKPCYNQTCPLYTPDSPANYVIEAKAGFASINGVTIGSVFQFG